MAEEQAKWRAKFNQEQAGLEAKLTKLSQEQQQTLVNTLMKRFPETPSKLIQTILEVKEPLPLHSLIAAAIQVGSVEEFEHMLTQTIAEAS